MLKETKTDEQYLVYTIDAFAKTNQMAPTAEVEGIRVKPVTSQKTGNPAGFVDLRAQKKSLADEVMLAIAAKVGFSETAFIYSAADADFEVRFFTPSDEVDLCGHATIGLFSGMYQLGFIDAGTYTQKTKAGRLAVTIDSNGAVLMTQAQPQYGLILDEIQRSQVAKSLGLEVTDLHETLPCQMVSTGLWDILVPLKSTEALEAIQPDFDAITEMSRGLSAVGYHVFALTEPTALTTKASCRNFAPLYAILEEAATGTSNGALAAYLCEKGQVMAPANFEFLQGVAMACPSVIEAAVSAKGEVKVGGKAANLKHRVVSV